VDLPVHDLLYPIRKTPRCPIDSAFFAERWEAIALLKGRIINRNYDP
jgi:hypothetical protein